MLGDARSAALAFVLGVVACDTAQTQDPPPDEPEVKVATAQAAPKINADPGPKTGEERGPCYGNGTCNEGLECRSELCVKASAPPPPPTAAAPEPSDPPQAEPDVAQAPAFRATPTSFDEFYVGTYGFGVNRVNYGQRKTTATIHREDGQLEIHAEISDGKFDARLDGVVQPIDKKTFEVHGTLKGHPDEEPHGERETEGVFTFKATKGRTYWRLYEVDGSDCVCDQGCGNDFCYVDVGPRK